MEAAKRINYCINEKGMKVYIHCTSSCTRSTSAVILYMCLYLRTVTYKQQWRNPEEVADYVKRCHSLSHPNMTIIHAAIRTWKSVQDQELHSLEQERENLLRKIGQEADRLRKLALEKLMAERDQKIR